MRFFENGPAIPGELLRARDEGRVVFFCGAGVSQAKANLPDFFGLAEKVMKKLGVQADSPAQKLLEEARKIEDKTGVAGVVPADRIFGLLEREFSTDVIAEKVASVLRPSAKPDLTAHRTILDLATTREGLVRIVTTNFDRLFDDCDCSLSSWQRPRLPDPSRPKDMNGIVYLHGKATSDYQRAEGDGFVLSSSQFGQAYLSEGWATSFFREIIDRYVVVFVGYAADDPPVHYLLEGLNRQINERQVYAFQAGDVDESASKWGHRGVQAIPYAEGSDHAALWKTLEAWAQRARDPDVWYAEIINKAKQGPQSLSPHERGQVAHVVSTVEGMRKFAAEEEPPPAEWLCVFDSYRRYGEPGKSGGFLQEGPYVDPFDLYRIDSDAPPDKSNSIDRKPPADAWDAFALDRIDKTTLSDGSLPSITGRWASEVPPLPSRLRQMGAWIRSVAGQPAAVWWAVRKTPLHPKIRDEIRWALRDSQRPIPPILRDAWYYLLEYWEQGKDWRDDGSVELKRRISKDGWSRSIVRAYAACYRPYLCVEPSQDNPKPPEQEDKVVREHLIDLDVVYPADKSETICIPDEWVTPVILVLRKNLETAIELEIEIGRRSLEHISSIVPDQNSASDHECGLSGAVIEFTSVFERLIQIDLEVAKREFAKWRSEDDAVFVRLRIWAASKPDLVPEDQFGSVLAEVSDGAFWNSSHEWDLLHTLSKRWNGLSADTRAKIEERLLKGRSRKKKETEDKFRNCRARSILARITWLSQRGCSLNLNLEEETDRLREVVPDWKPEHADEIVRYWGTRSRKVEYETDHSALLDIPLASVLPTARKLSERRDKPSVEHYPFRGLSNARPDRAFSALRMAAREGDFPDWAWSSFLYAEKRKEDKPKFIVLIAEQLACYLDNGATELVRPAASWLFKVRKCLSDKDPASFRRVTNALIQSLAKEAESGGSRIWQVDGVRNWMTTVLNEAARKIAQSVLCRAQQEDFLEYADELLALPSNMRRQALVVFAQWTSWFYTNKREWSEEKLLSVLDSSDSDDKDAFWGGFLSNTDVNLSQELFMRLKPHLFQLTKAGSETCRNHCEVLAKIILFKWGSVIGGTDERCISDGEFRNILIQADDKFRAHVLGLLEIWVRDDEEETRNKWKSLLPVFLEKVWPRQKRANSPAVSSPLCSLVLCNEDLFPELVQIILPLLVEIADLVRDYFPWDKCNNVAKKHPHKMLGLLYTVLPPDKASTWSRAWDIGEILTLISEGDPTLKDNEKFLELKLQWDSR